MGIFIVRDCIGGSADNLQVAFGADAEPGVVAIMQGFRNSVEAYHITVEAGTFFEVDHINGNMVEPGHGSGLSVAKAGKGEACKKEQPRNPGG